jgi:hypothetical protein
MRPKMLQGSSTMQSRAYAAQVCQVVQLSGTVARFHVSAECITEPCVLEQDCPAAA